MQRHESKISHQHVIHSSHNNYNYTFNLKKSNFTMKDFTDNILVYTPIILVLIGFYLSSIGTSSNVLFVHEIIGIFLMLLGFLFWIISAKYLAGFHSRDIKPKIKLQTKGPYRIVRHPMVFSWIVISISAGILFQSAETLPVLAIFCILLILRAKREEKYLEKKFGKQWENYKKKVGFILPNLSLSKT